MKCIQYVCRTIRYQKSTANLAAYSSEQSVENFAEALFVFFGNSREELSLEVFFCLFFRKLTQRDETVRDLKKAQKGHITSHKFSSRPFLLKLSNIFKSLSLRH